MKKAFTLAEVLITLTIIGIVAAITIPSVIANYQQREFKTGLQKAVSVLNEAIQANIAIEGETPYDRADMDNGGRLNNYLMRHMSVIKSAIGTIYVGSYFDNQDVYHGISSNDTFYTTDGFRFEIIPSGNGHAHSNIELHESGYSYASNYRNMEKTPCGSYGLANNPHKTAMPPCLILVDVNGDRKPTVYGTNITVSQDNTSHVQNYRYPNPSDKRLQDIFNILITEDRAIPFGVVAQRAMYEK